MMKVVWSVLGLFLFYLSTECLLPPSKEELNQMSQVGEKYLDRQIDNAISGVKEMKTVMERSEEEHKRMLSEMEKTQKQKENALKTAQEMKEKLSEEQSVCNETMEALWEECKPCLRKTCVKFYSRTCRSGSGLVGRQLEEILNRTSPISIFINGQSIETLLSEDQQQTRHFQDLEESYTEVSDGVENIFMDSLKVFDHMQMFHHPGFLPSRFQFPSMFGGQEGSSHAGRIYRSPMHDSLFHSLRSLFSPMERSKSMFEKNEERNFTSEGWKLNEKVTTDDKMTCREIRRNSFGCVKLKDECEKCQKIQHIDCSGKRPLEGPLKEELERALGKAEEFTQEFNNLLNIFQEQMFNTSSVLELFNKQFGWVSSLANHTQNEDGFFQIQAVMSKGSDTAENPADTRVSVKLFDGPDMIYTVPGDIPWSDPKFSEVVAQEALDRYKQNAVITKL